MGNRYVRETAAGQSISAWIILKGKREVATVQAHYSKSVTCLVNIWQRGDAYARSYAATQGKKVDPADDHAAFDAMSFQAASAGGYGYDKLTSALAGLYVDGHELTDHCSTKGAPRRPPNGLRRWPYKSEPPKGYEFANYQSRFITFGFNPEKHERDGFEGNDGYESCFRISGLKYLEALGYSVLQAI